MAEKNANAASNGGATIVAVSALGPTLDDKVDERFGRAAYLLFVDDNLEFEAVDNGTNRNALQGAGLGAAETVSNHSADAVITGHLGPKAFAALSHSGTPGYDGTGLTVRAAISELKAGRLSSLGEGEAHAGTS